MSLEAKKGNLRKKMSCGMNGHKNSIGLLINSKNPNKGKLDLFNEGTKSFSRDNIKFRPQDLIWMKIDLINENKTVAFYYEDESNVH